MTQTLGIDLSEWRSSLWGPQFDKLDRGGVRFCFTRATRGAEYHDPTMARYLRLSHERGWVNGIYHFLENADPLAQFRNFRSYAPHDADAYVLDVEQFGLKYWQVAVWVALFRKYYPGKKLGLYTRQTYLDARDWAGVKELFDYLWLARWTGPRWLSSTEEIPTVGRLEQFGTLKYGWKGGVKGIDGNVFNGTPVELMRFVT